MGHVGATRGQGAGVAVRGGYGSTERLRPNHVPTVEAEALNRQVLEARRRTLGPEHPDTLASMSNLALERLK